MSEENPTPNAGRVRRYKGHKDPFEAALEPTNASAPTVLDLGETPPEEETITEARMAARQRKQRAAEEGEGRAGRRSVTSRGPLGRACVDSQSRH